jgi:cytochrome c oxidase assembly protein Cox11
METIAFGEITVIIGEENLVLGKTNNTYHKIISRKQKQYNCAPVSTGNTFQDLLRLCENAGNTERYI